MTRRPTTVAGGLAAAAAVIVVAVIALAPAPRGDAAEPHVPAVELERLDGGRVPLTDGHGRVVVLNVWASWCEPCRDEMASLDRLHRALDPSRALVRGLNVDEDRRLAQEYLRRAPVGFDQFADTGGPFARTALAVHALPQTLLIEPDGRVRERVVGARDWSDPALARRLGLPLAADGRGGSNEGPAGTR